MTISELPDRHVELAHSSETITGGEDSVQKTRVQPYAGAVTRSSVERAEETDRQSAEDDSVRAQLAFITQALRAAGKLSDKVDFYLCGDPEEIGIGHETLAEMERAGYQNSGYGERSEGKELFAQAYRGYTPEERGDLRFVIVAESSEEGREHKPLAFFNYFRVNRHLYPECEEAAAKLTAERHLPREPEKYIISKLVADSELPRELVGVHRFALMGVVNGLAKTSEEGMFVETQAQPATRRMVRRAAEYIPDLEVVIDQEIPTDDNKRNPSKMLLYVPDTKET